MCIRDRINILKSEFNSLVNRRILIIAEDDAQVKLLICDHTVDESQFLATQVTEIFAGRNALVDYYDLEENSDKVTRLTNTFVHQLEASNVLINNMTFNTGVSRNNYNVKLSGQHAEAYVCGMAVSYTHLDVYKRQTGLRVWTHWRRSIIVGVHTFTEVTTQS